MDAAHTAPAVAARVTALFAARSGEERLAMVSDLFDTGRALILAKIAHDAPLTDAAGRAVGVFDRLYGQDLDAATRARIVLRIREAYRSA